MKKKLLAIFFCYLIGLSNLYTQTLKFDINQLEAVNVSMAVDKLMGKEAIKVIKDSSVKAFDEPTFVKLKDIDFKNGIIELKVLSRLLPNVPDFARGFIGIAFRINDSNTKFESIYIRPTNGRDSNQIRRNRAIQYFSYPEYQFERLRKEAPGQYESYADMGLNEWIQLKIIVQDNHAQLFINNNKQPSLIVNDLKHGTNSSGKIGLWVDIGTEGFFSDLKIEKSAR